MTELLGADDPANSEIRPMSLKPVVTPNALSGSGVPMLAVGPPVAGMGPLLPGQTASVGPTGSTVYGGSTVPVMICVSPRPAGRVPGSPALSGTPTGS